MTRSRAVPFRLKAPVVPEHSLQVSVTNVLTIELAPPGKVSADGVMWFAIDHANYAGEVPGVRIGRGIIAGIADIFLLYDGLAHFIELKTTEGKMSDSQMSVAAAVLASGGRVGVVTCAERVLRCIDTWEIPRKRRVNL